MLAAVGVAQDAWIAVARGVADHAVGVVVDDLLMAFLDHQVFEVVAVVVELDREALGGLPLEAAGDRDRGLGTELRVAGGAHRAEDRLLVDRDAA